MLAVRQVHHPKVKWSDFRPGDRFQQSSIGTKYVMGRSLNGQRIFLIDEETFACREVHPNDRVDITPLRECKPVVHQLGTLQIGDIFELDDALHILTNNNTFVSLSSGMSRRAEPGLLVEPIPATAIEVHR